MFIHRAFVGGSERERGKQKRKSSLWKESANLRRYVCQQWKPIRILIPLKLPYYMISQSCCFFFFFFFFIYAELKLQLKVFVFESGLKDGFSFFVLLCFDLCYPFLLSFNILPVSYKAIFITWVRIFVMGIFLLTCKVGNLLLMLE